MAAHAKAHESKRDPRDLEDPRDNRQLRGFVGSFSGYERNRFWVNVGAGEPYVECGFGMGVDFDHDGRSAVPIDMDGDGDLDLAMISLQGLRMMQNQAAGERRWIRIDVRATKTDAYAVGAVVRIDAGGRKQVERVRLTAGFHAQPSHELHFGLRDAEQADVTVEWPSGAKQTFPGLAAGERHVLVEGEAATTTRPLPKWPDEAKPRIVGRYSTKLKALDLKGRMRRIGWPGRATVVNFWATWCEPCERELPTLATLSKTLKGNADVVAIAVETDKLDAVTTFAREKGIDGFTRIATDELVRSFFGAEGKVALPTTFVFAPDGHLLRTFYREVKAADIEGLLAPYGDAPPIEDLQYLANYYLHEGRTDDARMLLSERIDEADGDPYLLNELAQLYLKLSDVDRAAKLVDTALKLDRNDADIWNTHGEIRGVRGDLKGAKKALQTALDLAPRHARALNNMGMVAKLRGDLGEAIRYFRKALEVEPSYEKAQKNLDETLVDEAGPVRRNGIEVP